MPPTHFEGGKVNRFQPYVVGQSGTERPEPVLVTRLPASTRSTVQPATKVAKRWSISGPERRERRERREGWAGRFAFQPIPPFLPFLPEKLVAGCCCFHGRLEGEGNLLRVLLAERDLLL